MQDRQGTNDLANGAVRYGVYGAAGSLLRYEWIRPEDEPRSTAKAVTWFTGCSWDGFWSGGYRCRRPTGRRHRGPVVGQLYSGP